MASQRFTVYCNRSGTYFNALWTRNHLNCGKNVIICYSALYRCNFLHLSVVMKYNSSWHCILFRRGYGVVISDQKWWVWLSMYNIQAWGILNIFNDKYHGCEYKIFVCSCFEYSSLLLTASGRCRQISDPLRHVYTIGHIVRNACLILDITPMRRVPGS